MDIKKIFLEVFVFRVSHTFPREFNQLQQKTFKVIKVC